jgi:hypothetical protein
MEGTGSDECHEGKCSNNSLKTVWIVVPGCRRRNGFRSHHCIKCSGLYIDTLMSCRIALAVCHSRT